MAFTSKGLLSQCGDRPAHRQRTGGSSGVRHLEFEGRPTDGNLGSNRISSIESGAFGGLTNLTYLDLGFNRISSIESGDFGGLTNLLDLVLWENQISSIESGAFSGFTSLRGLFLGGNTRLTELNLDEAALSSLSEFGVGNEMVRANWAIASVSLKNAVLDQHSLVTLLDGGAAVWNE